jgi:hypothetical protein
LTNQKLSFEGVGSYFDHREVLENYIRAKVRFTEVVSGNKVDCPIQTIAIIQKDIPAIISQ